MFPDEKSFHNLFRKNLEAMLSPEEVGAFILVLANSMQDPQLMRGLAEPIQQMFSHFQNALPEIRNGDDRIVIDALLKTGIDEFHSWKSRMAGSYEIVFNPLRALRPARMARESLSTLCEPFSESGFNFNRAFLKREILWEGRYLNHDFRVLYNKFPFAPYHLLIAPDPQRELAQCLSAEHHMLAWELVAEMAHSLPGFGMAYNSLGAGASVNHLHFQGFVRAEPFPAELPYWKHRGGSVEYAVKCEVAESAGDALELISGFHCLEQPYNLLYRPGRCYLFHRNLNQVDLLPSWIETVAWHEACGVMTIADRDVFDSITAEEVDLLLQRVNGKTI